MGTVYEAMIDQNGGRYAMRRPLPDPESASVAAWAARLRDDEYGIVNVTKHLSGIVQLPPDMPTDRGVQYFAVTFYPLDPPTLYAVWEE